MNALCAKAGSCHRPRFSCGWTQIGTQPLQDPPFPILADLGPARWVFILLRDGPTDSAHVHTGTVVPDFRSCAHPFHKRSLSACCAPGTGEVSLMGKGWGGVMAAPPGLRKWAAHVVSHRHPSPARLFADRIIRPGCRYHVARDSRLRCLASCRGHVGTARHPARVCGAGATRQAPRCGQSPSRRLRSLCLGAVWARSLFSGRGSALCTEASSPAPTHGCQQ